MGTVERSTRQGERRAPSGRRRRGPWAASEPSGLAPRVRGPLGRWSRGGLAAEGGARAASPPALWCARAPCAVLLLQRSLWLLGAGTLAGPGSRAGRGPGPSGLAVGEGALGSCSVGPRLGTVGYSIGPAWPLPTCCQGASPWAGSLSADTIQHSWGPRTPSTRWRRGNQWLGPWACGLSHSFLQAWVFWCLCDSVTCPVYRCV